MKDLPKVPTWLLEWDLNLLPSGRKARNLPLSHQPSFIILCPFPGNGTVQTSKHPVGGGAFEAPGVGEEAPAEAAEGRCQDEGGHVPPEPQDRSQPVQRGTGTRPDPTGGCGFMAISVAE